jgi:hypothetical protein
MKKTLYGFEVRYVPRLDNRDADHLAWIASSKAPTPPDIIVDKLSKPSVKAAESSEVAIGQDLMLIDDLEQDSMFDWMHPINMFLENQPPSYDNAKVECIAKKSKQYHMIDVILFRRGANDMMMKCISREEDIQLLCDIHNGICKSHSSWRSIIDKAFRHELYWPVAKDDMMEIVTKCRDCQFFQKQTTKHANPLWPINLSCPFTIWGIDVVGMLLMALGGYMFLFIAIDMLTKWMEAMSIVNITQEKAAKFLQSIMFRFGMPRWVLIDNGTQFKGAKFVRCCANFDIEHQVSSTVHP